MPDIDLVLLIYAMKSDQSPTSNAFFWAAIIAGVPVIICTTRSALENVNATGHRDLKGGGDTKVLSNSVCSPVYMLGICTTWY